MKRSLQEFADFVFDMSLKNPNGFRHPGKQGANRSLIHTSAVAAGYAEADEGYSSKRGKAKRRRDREMRQKIAADRLKWGCDTPPEHRNLGVRLRDIANA
jgi:hypothetical protein